MAVITGEANQGPQKTAWDEITGVASRFIAADRYLIAVRCGTAAYHIASSNIST